MERKNRPLGREKKVVSGTAHVGRRQGAGPVGGSAQRPQSGGAGGFGGGQRSYGGGQRGRAGSPLIKLIILAAIVLFGGGGTLSAFLGGGGGTTSSPATPPMTAQNNVVNTAHSGSYGKLDTTVSKDARAKRVALKGNGSDTTTVMVYMCGTDLESRGGYATKDLQEMMAADIGENINLLVWTGGCKQWKNNLVSASKNQIFQIKRGDMALLAETDSLSPMTDPKTLTQFLSWGEENFPADRYELIFWDHGGGSVSGYGYDEVFPRSGSMTLDGIAQALKDANLTFDFIGFDACLMATLETALVAEPYADYLIASEETEPGCGWYYTNWLSELSADPSLPALEIGKTICDSFVSACGQVAARQQATLSVIDLAELHGTVPGPFASFAAATGKTIKTDDYKSVAAARGRTKEFAQNNKIDQVDLIHLANNLNTPESRALAEALDGAVKYNATSRNIQNANGVSIYFPYGRTSSVNKMAQIYEKIDLDDSYTDCIKSFASLEVAGQTVAGGSSGQLNSLFGALMSGGGGSSSGGIDASAVGQLLGALLQNSGRELPNVGLEAEEAEFLDAELLENSEMYLAENRFDPSALVWTEKGAQKVLSLTEEQWELVQDVELNVFVDDGAGYIDLGLDNVLEFTDDGDLLGEYDQTWLSVNGQVVAYYMLESVGTEEDYKITGYIPAMLNGQRVDLMAAFTDELPEGEILGAAVRYDEDAETATIARGLIEIQDGDVIDFLCDYYGYDRSFQDAYYLGDPLTVSGPLSLGNIKLDNREYVAAYRVTDIYRNHYWTPSL